MTKIYLKNKYLDDEKIKVIQIQIILSPEVHLLDITGCDVDSVISIRPIFATTCCKVLDKGQCL